MAAVVGYELGRPPLRVVGAGQDRLDGLGFFLPGGEEHGVVGGEQDAGEEGNAPTIEFLYIDGGGDVGAVVEQGLAGEEAGSVGVGTEAEVDHVERGQEAFFEAEEILEVLEVALSGVVGTKLTVDAMNLRGGQVEGVQKSFAGETVVAVGVVGGDAALVDPEDMDLVPVEGIASSSELGEQGAGNRAAGQGQGGGGLAGEGVGEACQDEVGGGLGGGL